VFISIHIPKTAGATLGYLFDHGSGRKVLWDYTPYCVNVNNIDHAWLEHASFIEQTFWGIHGHFSYRKYHGIFPSAKTITCLRHPVERLESQFKCEVYNALSGMNHWRADALLDGRYSFVDFVRSDESTRIGQVLYLDGRDIIDYDFVFISEFLTPCIEAFSRMFNFRRRDPESNSGIPRINDGRRRYFLEAREAARFEGLTCISDEDRRKVFALIPEEVDLYRRGAEYTCRLIRAS
jgi:hypothetical protein